MLQWTPKKYKEVIRDNYKQLYNNKKKNLEEMDKFSERYNHQTLNQG